MKGAILGLILVCVLLNPRTSEAQKVYYIAALVSADSFMPAFDGFKKKMIELGYTEGKNVKYSLHHGKGDPERLKGLAQKISQEKPDLIITSSTTATLPIAKATEGTNLPVVFLNVGNPLEFVKDYASSGNNLTGVSAATLELTAKRLELIKDIAPRVKRVASLNNPKGLNYRENLVAVREGAERLGLSIVEVNVTSPKELAQATATMSRKVADAVLTQPDPIISGNIEIVIKHSIKAKLPLVPTLISSVEKGGLATYGPDYFALGAQGAMLVDKILKGAKPLSLPIEQPNKLVLVINLKTAKAIGLKISKEILLRADEVIE